jgi:hypothetical protein
MKLYNFLLFTLASLSVMNETLAEGFNPHRAEVARGNAVLYNGPHWVKVLGLVAIIAFFVWWIYHIFFRKSKYKGHE